MSFLTEIVKSQRVRRAYLRFALEENQAGRLWLGDVDRRYGKTDDPLGLIPVQGTVSRFGLVTRALANYQRSIETPSLAVELLDPDGEWRALAGSDTDELLYRNLSLWIRVHDDLGLNVYDRRVVVGQIQRPSFPAGGRSVRLDCRVANGRFLGEKVPRRLITTKDWSGAPPESQGLAVPIIYGVHYNEVRPYAPPEPPPTPEPSTEGIPGGDPGDDPATLPPITGTETVRCGDLFADDYESGLSGYSAGAGDHSIVAGAGSGGSAAVRPSDPTKTLTRVVANATRAFCISWASDSDQTPTAEVVASAPLGIFREGTDIVIEVPIYGELTRLEDMLTPETFQTFKAEGAFATTNFTTTLAVDMADDATTLQVATGQGGRFTPGKRIWIDTECLLVNSVATDTLTVTRAQGSSVAAAHATGAVVTSRDTNGYLRFYVDEVVRATFLNDDRFHSGSDVGTWSTVEVGFSGDGDLLSVGSGLTFADGGGPGEEEPGYPPEETSPYAGSPEAPMPTPQCQPEEDGGGSPSGGAIRALLVGPYVSSPTNTGGTGTAPLPIGNYPVPTGLTAVLQPEVPAAPTLSATRLAGGEGQAGRTQYYAIATLHPPVTSGRYPGYTLSKLSNVVSITSTDDERQVQLSWSGLAAGAVKVRVYRGNNPDFTQFDRYRVSGNPYSSNDLDASETGVIDEWFGVVTSSQLDPDPHWDLQYRQQFYYSVSALYADGGESLCSPLVQVNYYPNQEGAREIDVSWAAPGAGPAALTGYRVRRVGQIYSFDIGTQPQMQWDFPVGTTSFTDTLSDTGYTGSPCPGGDPAAVSSANNVYVLAGHALKEVTEVYVRKPIIVEGFSGTDGTPMRSEPVQVLQVEGTDYTQRIVDINGNRYHVLEFAQAQLSETCEYYEVTANVKGIERNGDGTGELLTDAVEVFDHYMLNWVFNSYRSSIGPGAPPDGPWFTDVPYAPGLWSAAAVQVAKAVSGRRISGGYQARVYLDEAQEVPAQVAEALVSFDLELHFDNQTGPSGAWSVSMFDPYVARASLDLYDASDVIFRETFEIDVLPTIFNVIPYFAGPTTQRTGKNETGTRMVGGGWLLSGELPDSGSISKYGMSISEPVYLRWTDHQPTVLDVVQHYLDYQKYPTVVGTFRAGLRPLASSLSALIRVTHPDGTSSTSGWVERVCKLYRGDIDLDRLTMSVELVDVDRFVPTE